VKNNKSDMYLPYFSQHNWTLRPTPDCIRPKNTSTVLCFVFYCCGLSAVFNKLMMMMMTYD